MTETGGTSKAGGLRQPAEFVMGLTLAALSLVGLVWLVPTHVSSEAAAYDVGPAFFPKMTLYIVLVLSLIMALFAAIGRQAAAIDGSTLRRGSAEAAVWFFVSVAVLVLIPRIGFIPVAIGLLVVAFLVARERVWWRIALLSVAVPFATAFFAQSVFQVTMP